MRIFDRYVVREALGPFLLALGLFTFLFAVRPMLDHAQSLLAKGVDPQTVAFLLVLLLPQALGITIPMAFMASVLMALGRLSGDREGVALLACGVSPLRLLRPLVLLAILAGGANFYTLTRLVPDSNQRFREETFRLLVRQSEGDIKPGVFYQGFPGKLLYVRERLPDESGWAGVILADTSQPDRPILTLADRGRLEIDPERRQVAIVLPGLSYRYIPGDAGGVYDTATSRDLRVAVPADSVFPDGNLQVVRGRTEMGIADLRAEEARKRAAGLSPHNEIMQRHQMFSFPVACVVFAVIGLALGLHTRKDGRLGGFTLGIAVICAYYGVMALFENLTKGMKFPAEWARWMPNILLAAVGGLAVWWRTRSAGRELTIALPAWVRWPARRRGTSEATGRPGPRPRVVIVLRVPNVRLPRPRLLDLYVGRRYLNVVGVSFVGLLAFYYVATFIDKSERLFKGQATAGLMAQYFYFSTPQFVAYIMPMAILLAVLATIGGLMRSGELVVMRSCGVSLYRAAMPLVVVAFIWSGGLFLLDDRVLAKANRRAEVIEETIKGNPPPMQAPIEHANWLIDSKRRFYYYTAFDTAHETLYGLSVFETTASPFQLTSHAWIAKASYTRQGWRAESGWVQRFAGADRAVRESFTNRLVNLDPPSRFPGMFNQDVSLMTYSQLRRQVSDLSQSGLTLVDSQVRLQARVAFPFVAVVMTLLGIPFGATTGRRGALYGVAVALILGSAYWMMNTFFLAVGQAALLPAALAAWATNILFLAAALYLTLTVRT